MKALILFREEKPVQNKVSVRATTPSPAQRYTPGVVYEALSV